MIADASVAWKWLITEEDSALADELLNRADLAAPTILPTEIGHALTKRVRQSAFSRSVALGAWAVSSRIRIRLTETDAIGASALDLSLRLNASYFDCLYLALAIAEEDILVTADARFVRAAEADARLKGRVRLLSASD